MSLSLGRHYWMKTLSTLLVRQDKSPSNFDFSIEMFSFLNIANRMSFYLDPKCTFSATAVKSSKKWSPIWTSWTRFTKLHLPPLKIFSMQSGGQLITTVLSVHTECSHALNTQQMSIFWMYWHHSIGLLYVNKEPLPAETINDAWWSNGTSDNNNLSELRPLFKLVPCGDNRSIISLHFAGFFPRNDS